MLVLKYREVAINFVGPTLLHVVWSVTGEFRQPEC